VDAIEHATVGPGMREVFDRMAEAGTIWTPTLAVLEALAHADRPRTYFDDAYPKFGARLRPTARAPALAACRVVRPGLVRSPTSSAFTLRSQNVSRGLRGRFGPGGLAAGTGLLLVGRPGPGASARLPARAGTHRLGRLRLDASEARPLDLDPLDLGSGAGQAASGTWLPVSASP
jgi:hypothetical protein